MAGEKALAESKKTKQKVNVLSSGLGTSRAQAVGSALFPPQSANSTVSYRHL